jgi:hypothetical protein
MAFCVTNVTAISIIDDSPSSGTCLTSTANNISIVRGSTFTLIFDLKDGTDAADITGYSINAVIKPSSTSSTELLFMSTQNRMISIDYDNARATLTIPVKHTSRLPLGTKYFFIRLVASNGNTQKIIQGIATVSDS